MDDITGHLCGPGDERLFGRGANEVFDDPIDREKLARNLALARRGKVYNYQPIDRALLSTP